LGKWVDIHKPVALKPYPKSRLKKVIEHSFFPHHKQAQGIQPFTRIGFGSLLRRWNAFADRTQFPVVEWKGLTAAYELKTHAFKMKGGAEIGSCGCGMNFRLPAIATVLAHFACCWSWTQDGDGNGTGKGCCT